MSLRVGSRNRLSSRGSIRSAGDSASSIKRATISSSTLLQKVVDDEEIELIVYAVREELIKRVMDEIYERYIEKQSINFMVHCAHKAFIQIIDLDSLEHDKGPPFYENHPAWTPDVPLEPSPPDTWAGYNVPVVTEEKEEEQGPASAETIPEQVPSLSDVVPSPDQVTVNESEKQSEYVLEDVDFERKKSVSTEIELSDFLVGPNTSEVFIDSVFPEEEEPVVEQLSIFTNLAIKPRETFQAVSAFIPPKPKETKSKLPKIVSERKVKSTAVADTHVSMQSLPPIRADTTLQKSISEQAVKGKKKK